jgi:hypothetical protein
MRNIRGYDFHFQRSVGCFSQRSRRLSLGGVVGDCVGVTNGGKTSVYSTNSTTTLGFADDEKEETMILISHTLWCTGSITLAGGETPKISLVCENGHTLEPSGNSLHGQLF